MTIRIMFAIIISSITLSFAQNYKDTVYIDVAFSKPIDTLTINLNQWVLVNLSNMTRVPLYAWASRWHKYDKFGNLISVGNADLSKVDSLIVVAGRHYASSTYRVYVYGIKDNYGISMIEDSIHNSKTYYTDGAFPVELSTFTAKQRQNKIDLYWRTETEINNYGFDIERKFIYETEWKKIGFVEGHGNSNSPKEYRYIDNMYGIGSNVEVLYRLKQIDSDGTTEYSKIIILEFKGIVKDFNLSIYPNPFNPSTTVQVSLPEKDDVELKIYSVLGEEVYKKVIEGAEGIIKIPVDMSNLSSGIYFFVTKIKNNTLVKQGILLK